MKHIGSYLILILFSIILGSCSKNSSTEICLKDVCIDGEWQWVESYGSIAGLTITPESEMQTRKLIIDENRYREFVDDELIVDKAYEYVISDELSVFTNDSLVLKLDSGNWYAVFGSENQLILTEPCADCWSHTYSKE